MADTTTTPDEVTAALSDRFAALPPEVREAFAVAVEKLASDPVQALLASDAMKPMALRAEAVRLQQAAGDLYDQADRLEQASALEAVRTQADEAAWQIAYRADELEFVLRDAITQERAAEDRCRAAEEHHRVAAEAERAAQRDHADPRTATDALVRVRAAADVAARERAAYEGATAARINAEAALAAERAWLAEAEEVERIAIAAVNDPPPCPPTVITLVQDGLRRFVAKQTTGWGDEQFGQIEWIVETLATATGVDRIFTNRARKELEEENRRKASNAILPKAGHSLRPADTGTVFAPLPPRVG